MKITITHLLLPAIVLGGVLLTPGCTTTTALPTITIGTPAKTDRSVLLVTSPVPTKVRCVWRQDGARYDHRNTTPFRLVLPGRDVHEISLSKPTEAARVAVEIRLPGTEPSRFVMDRGSSGMKLVSDRRHWEGRVF